MELIKYRKKLNEFCSPIFCSQCPIDREWNDHRCGRGTSFETLKSYDDDTFDMTKEEILKAYEIAFGEQIYWPQKIKLEDLQNFLKG